MSLAFKKRTNEVTMQPTPVTGGDEAAAMPQSDSRNVLVTHGIHRGRFPIGGMAIRDARRVLQRLINIDPAAVPVINGAPVDENTVIAENISMLAFVKPSAIKG
jgi:hypothetical protein